MNTQDPYSDLPSLTTHDEYPGYDDFVPYRNDWRYGMSFFSILMIGALVYGYWKLAPETKVNPVAAIHATKVAVAHPVKDSVAVQPEAPKAVVNQKAAARPKAVAKRTSKPPQAATQQKKADPMKTVTAPSSY